MNKKKLKPRKKKTPARKTWGKKLDEVYGWLSKMNQTVPVADTVRAKYDSNIKILGSFSKLIEDLDPNPDVAGFKKNLKEMIDKVDNAWVEMSVEDARPLVVLQSLFDFLPKEAQKTIVQFQMYFVPNLWNILNYAFDVKNKNMDFKKQKLRLTALSAALDLCEKAFPIGVNLGVSVVVEGEVKVTELGSIIFGGFKAVAEIRKEWIGLYKI